MKIHFSDHAKEQMVDRGISVEMVLEVIENPEQKYNQELDETVCQAKINFDEKLYLLRVFVNFIKHPPIVISVYRTSKIHKYWRKK
ncbi:DUF4258 domain-containing protein [Deltaproteobacteria bacterium TL4]